LILFQNFTWYQKVAILPLCDGIGRVPIQYPWNDGGVVMKNLQTLHEIPLILSSWPGDNSSLFENFIRDNFNADDADLLSQVMILAVDRDKERTKEDMHIFAKSIYAIRQTSHNWEEMLIDSERENGAGICEDAKMENEKLSTISRSHEGLTVKDSSDTMFSKSHFWHRCHCAHF
ncbi:hypothetical protein COOONC_02131, partial [Cooperia oncophora]